MKRSFDLPSRSASGPASSLKGHSRSDGVSSSREAHRDRAYAVSRVRAGFSLGLGLFGVLFALVFFVQYFSVSLGLQMTGSFMKQYPDGSNFVYFDVFGYLKNFADTFHRVGSMFSGFWVWHVTDYGTDVIAWIKNFINFFIFFFNVLLIPLKALLVAPLYLLFALFGMQINVGFGSVITTLYTWWGSKLV